VTCWNARALFAKCVPRLGIARLLPSSLIRGGSGTMALGEMPVSSFFFLL
jgi:hypothetical protein